jgi:hypothetical protein
MAITMSGSPESLSSNGFYNLDNRDVVHTLTLRNTLLVNEVLGFYCVGERNDLDDGIHVTVAVTARVKAKLSILLACYVKM